MCKCLLTLLAFLLPPLAVLFHSGCNCNFIINLLLTVLGVIPGIIHALYILWCYQPPVMHTHTTVYIQGRPDAPPAYQ